MAIAGWEELGLNIRVPAKNFSNLLYYVDSEYYLE